MTPSERGERCAGISPHADALLAKHGDECGAHRASLSVRLVALAAHALPHHCERGLLQCLIIWRQGNRGRVASPVARALTRHRRCLRGALTQAHARSRGEEKARRARSSLSLSARTGGGPAERSAEGRRPRRESAVCHAARQARADARGMRARSMRIKPSQRTRKTLHQNASKNCVPF